MIAIFTPHLSQLVNKHLVFVSGLLSGSSLTSEIILWMQILLKACLHCIYLFYLAASNRLAGAVISSSFAKKTALKREQMIITQKSIIICWITCHNLPS